MSQQMTSKVELELPAGPVVTERRASLRWLMLAVGLVVVLALPWFVYPPVAMDIAAWGLFAISVDLLLGYTGLLSFGHAAFWGTSAYATGLIAIHAGLPFPSGRHRRRGRRDGASPCRPATSRSGAPASTSRW